MGTLFELLADSDVTPRRSKLHLATPNGGCDPRELYRAGRFDEWQSCQSSKRKPFSSRKFVVALIDLRLPRDQPKRWLFAGVQEIVGEEVREGAVHYQMQPRTRCEAFKNLIVRFERPCRYAYPYADRVDASIFEVHEEDQDDPNLDAYIRRPSPRGARR
ncbi:MAG: hypothetical protein OXG35_15770 [Acidobacteria bacterium]|nr:hypothetical protein [Acidobacteriota bacterium]